MREIKFRAWVPKEKEMCDWQELIDDHYEFDEFNNEGGLVFLQYTGLKDKNGKEIYEGDIVKYPPADICRRPAEVYWEEEGCQFRLATGGDRQFDKTRMIRLSRIGEVIGNIYENPELLAT